MGIFNDAKQRPDAYNDALKRVDSFIKAKGEQQIDTRVDA
jgi:hypothetical protein